MRLILGNKNYSSWSMRAGVAALAFDIHVDVETIWLEEPDALELKKSVSPVGRVPVLIDEDLTIWDSLAICEYWAECFPERGMWPSNAQDRARARSLTAEMHSGFAALRAVMPMNIRATKPTPEIDSELANDLGRVFEIFAEARGPFMFGEFSITDAFFAPVASRLRTYQIDVPTDAADYAQRLLTHPIVLAWVEAGSSEEHSFPLYD